MKSPAKSALLGNPSKLEAEDQQENIPGISLPSYAATIQSFKKREINRK